MYGGRRRAADRIQHIVEKLRQSIRKWAVTNQWQLQCQKFVAHPLEKTQLGKKENEYQKS